MMIEVAFTAFIWTGTIGIAAMVVLVIYIALSK